MRIRNYTYNMHLNNVLLQLGVNIFPKNEVVRTQVFFKMEGVFYKNPAASIQYKALVLESSC